MALNCQFHSPAVLNPPTIGQEAGPAIEPFYVGLGSWKGKFQRYQVSNPDRLVCNTVRHEKS
jgi:hypothetical protein